MSWSDVGKTVAGFAPLLGKLLPIPFAGVAGDLIASAFGVESKPDAVLAAIKADPEAGVKIAKIEADNRALLQQQVLTAETNRIESVNKTMREESKSEHWPQYSWRPFWGFASGLGFLAVTILVSLLAWRAVMLGDGAALQMIPSFVTSMSTLFGIPMIILGVSAHHRGKQKREMAQRGI